MLDVGPVTRILIVALPALELHVRRLELTVYFCLSSWFRIANADKEGFELSPLFSQHPNLDPNLLRYLSHPP